jgi:phosphoglycerate dehydrogenase-like enzyme
VAHSNDSLAEAVAEFTIGTIIACRRQMFWAANRLKAGQRGPSYTTMRELPGTTIGIIGASAIGRRVMDLLRPWKVRILLSDPYATPELAARYDAELVDLDSLMRASQVVSLHAPVTPETLNMLRSEHFAAMQDGALFINTARGRLVDHAALLAELQTGRIYAALDVTDPTEPLPPNSPFFYLENCVVFPHIAGHSIEARIRQGQMVGDDVVAYLKGEPLRYEVDVRRWEILA